MASSLPSLNLSSSAVFSTSSFIPPNLALLITNLNAFVTVKLDATNFIIWQNQVHNILKATQLLSFVDGTQACPSSTIVDKHNHEVPNPDYLNWMLIDSHLLSCLTATLSPSIFTSVLHCSTSHEVWSVLLKRFTSLSRSHIHQLKNKLSQIVKKGHTMDTYLTPIKSIADQLALAASPVDDEDLVLLILNGLPDEYNAFKTAIRTRVETISIEELCSLLNSESIHVESASKQALALELPFAYHVSSTSSRGGFRGGSYRGRGGGKSGNRFFKGTSSSTFRGRGGRSSTSGQGHTGQGHTGSQSYQSSSAAHSAAYPSHFSQVICQICGKLNHSALECWYRLDTSSFHSSRPQTHQAYITNTNQSATGSSGNSSLNTANWFLDSAASSHITNDLNNLSSYQPYHGHDQVTVGDGSVLPIHHTGQGQEYQEGAI